MSKSFPQYAKTDHPEVLQALAENISLEREFGKQVDALAERLTGNSEAGFINGSLLRGYAMVGIDADYADVLPGKWKKPQQGVVEPYKNNPIYDEMQAISYRPVSVPGRGNVLFGFNGAGRVMGTGLVFEYEGYVYSGLTFTIEAGRTGDFEQYGWVEIMPSEFHLALEAENKRREEARA